MKKTCRQLIEQLNREKKLAHEEWKQLLTEFVPEDAAYAAELARRIAVSRFGKKIYFRGIIEFTNFCKNDCYYCGIRRSNKNADRYRLSGEEILECCREGYECGFRTFVLQGGEDGYFTDEVLTDLVSTIRRRYPDCAITLSVGERSRESYQKLYDAGADRYLLRHETADKALYEKWHPKTQTMENRMRCLKDLKEIGYQTGCGIMVGAPYQTADEIAADMEMMTDFEPQMIGIGPFIPHSDTPFRDQAAGSAELTLFLLSLCRILFPDVLLPATTALGTLQEDGRKRGVLAGCNVVMPNLSPESVRKKYMLYDNKAGTEDTAASGIEKLTAQMDAIGYQVIAGRGDYQRREEALI
ncbi:MAG: [FeFe] hydrogenase H-cluster radical SAM maturase HydE [Lachnospiraceae bacterium]